MKILYHHRIGSRDGQSVHLEELLEALRHRGHDVDLVGPERFARTSFGGSSPMIDRLKRLMPRFAYELLEIGYNIPAYLRLRKAWRSLCPDAVYERYNLYLLAGVWLRRRTGVRLLLEVNAPLARERRVHGGLAFPRLASRLEKWAWRGADFVLPVTQVLADEVRKAGVPSERIVVIPNGINPARFAGHQNLEDAKARLGLSGKLVLGFTGFVRDWHGLDAVIDWLARPSTPPNAYLLLVGDGPAADDLKQQASQLGVETRVRFTGVVGRDAISGMVAAFDIALQPKCVEYASPLKLFEYMALGKAIIAPDQPNIREVLTQDVSGVLFDPSNKSSMIEAINRLASNHELRSEIGQGAQELDSNTKIYMERERTPDYGSSSH